MALNEDIALIRPMLISGLVKGGDDKQAVCEKVRKFREAKDKKGLQKFLTDLETERKAVNAEKGDSGATISHLTKLVIELQNRLDAIENKPDKLGADKPLTNIQTNNKTGGQ